MSQAIPGNSADTPDPGVAPAAKRPRRGGIAARGRGKPPPRTQHDFVQYSAELDARNDQRERIYKLSRDVTRNAKKVISLLQRTTGAGQVEVVNAAEGTEEAASQSTPSPSPGGDQPRGGGRGGHFGRGGARGGGRGGFFRGPPVQESAPNCPLFPESSRPGGSFLVTSTSGRSLLRQAWQALHDVHRDIGEVMKELEDEGDYFRFERNFSPGLQEYVEAVAFFHYLNDGTLVSRARIESDVQRSLDAIHATTTSTTSLTAETSTPDSAAASPSTPLAPTVSTAPAVKQFKLSHMDYLLGLTDVTGEVMRFATNAASTGDQATAQVICDFIRVLYGQLQRVAENVSPFYGLSEKLNVMLDSLKKVETICYKVEIRSREAIPLAHVLSSGPPALPFPEDEGYGGGGGGGGYGRRNRGGEGGWSQGGQDGGNF